ncbi:hypothetical protein N7462_007613 [Penicillium macrosclerotiorum]|uniref:uncharacterized protein n=1 Tax=Penicillium macrosclerotiorum TaxID=303699 RepID=UPI00254846B5|nr:uncharacterized protein N7462_007613 [Penicillium macrosclerotiorum]KAJ5679369.1 hypothetical protein N7462_007613 [Penicillium macrosclerotiorum]
MNNWQASTHVGDEQPSSSQYPGWPVSANLHSQTSPNPSRGERAARPTLLTTALSGSQLYHASTPLSTTSLSSPFTLTQAQSPAVSTPVQDISSSSMALRHHAAYTIPYNPQDWGPVGGPAAQAAYPQSNNVHRVIHQQRAHADASLSPPPPPYSPPHNQTRAPQDAYAQAGPNNGAAPPPPASHQSYRSGEFENPVDYQRQPVHRPRPLSMVYGNETELYRQSLPPPPPPQGNLGSRSVSQQRNDNYQNIAYRSPLTPSQSRTSTSGYDQSVSSPGPLNHLPGPASGLYDAQLRPPASRRAASAGAVPSSAGSSRAPALSRGPSPSTNGWGLGMSLPPPPPGPPPTNRAVSVSGSSESSSARTPQAQGSNRPRARPPPLMGTGLGSIPPTPAGWVDEEYINHRPDVQQESPPVDTVSIVQSPVQSPDPISSPNPNQQSQQSQRTPSSGGNGLFRSSAVRDSSAKGIRERRIERRNRQSQVLDDTNAGTPISSNPWADALEQIVPSDLVFPETTDSPDHTRQASSRYTPRSTRSIGSDGPFPTSRSRASSTGLFSDQSPSLHTPKVGQSPAPPLTSFAHTPPFSPNGESSSSYPKVVSQAVPPKALPTPPLNSATESQPRSRAPSRGSEDRPISHILHIPNDTVTMMRPLSPRRLPPLQTGQQTSSEPAVKQDTLFVQNSIERYKIFIEQEANAADEAEALKLFTEFIISESQIRRRRYESVFDAGSFDSGNVLKRLFEIPSDDQSSRSIRPNPTLQIPSTRPSRPESAWWNNYQPCLSPIASLGMSNDEMSSRGRAPSRWWESKTGSSSDGAGRKVQRSKRESKYMGLPREAMQWDQDPQQTPSKLDDIASNYTDHRASYGPDEYPAEKVGWHENSTNTAASGAGSAYSSAANGNQIMQPPTIQKLDISRLVTLPPPYPRHYPAVNNSHPDLVTYRTIVRSITDLTEIKATRERYQADIEKMTQDHQNQVREGRRHFKSNIQSQIQEGSLTFAEAAEAEAAMMVDDNKRERELVKRQLDEYQDSLLRPIHAILSDRIAKATTCIDELSSRLFDDAQHETPDQTQEQGDEKPELLEKLTQLKWLFEAREQLHRETFDLISGRDEKYKVVALLPYQQSKNDEKLRETQAFFSKDALDRRVQYETSALARLESFLDVIEQNVVRGVEVQLSAFWDIAPSLLTLVQQVPENLQGFQVQIPVSEYEENPSYHSHPLQYLYSLVSHAERSSYQYIESQTNLLCLLHEVRSALMRANRNLAEADRIWRGEPEEYVRRDMQTARADEELALTTDLKDKVTTVEGQWAEALGSQIEGLRSRIKDQLLAEDGWEEMEQLEQE